MLGVVVLTVAIIALQGPGNSGVQAGSRVPGGGPGQSASLSSAAPHSGAARSGATTSASTGAPRMPLVVLNNTTITGLAKRASRTFEQGGWTVTKYSNYTNDILSTCAYYDPGASGAEAAANALRAQFPGIKRVKPQFSELSAWHSPIVVILTPDWVSS